MNYENKGGDERTQSLGGGAEEVPGQFKSNRTEINVMDASTRPQFVGLSKEELARYENDPFWKKVRLGLLLAFWAIWLILLIAAILLLVRTPKCPKVYNLKWSRKFPGYAICLDKFTAPLVGHTGDQAAQLSALADRLSYVRQMNFRYVVLFDQLLPPENGNASVAAMFKPLREKANALGMWLVLEVQNKFICKQDEDHSDEPGCERLNGIVDSVLRDYDFDGISLSVNQNEETAFPPSAVASAKKHVESISKSTLKPRSLIATGVSKFDELEADVKVSNRLTSWNEKSTANDIVTMIEESMGCNGWTLDGITQPTVASDERKLDTSLALHTVYLLPGTPIITYGTESFIKSGECSPPVMPWTSSTRYPGAGCPVQSDVNVHNVETVSANGYPHSPYKLIRSLSDLREANPIFTFGTISSLKTIYDKVVYWEIHEHLYPIIVVIMNVSPNATVVSLESPIFTDKEGCHLTILYQANTDWTVNNEIQCGSVYLKENAVVVLRSKTTLQEKGSPSTPQ